MNLDDRMQLFQAVGENLLEESKMPGAFHVIALKDKGFRISLEGRGKQKGWAMEPRTTLTEFKKRFEKELSELLR